jgi:hypothetical protein
MSAGARGLTFAGPLVLACATPAAPSAGTCFPGDLKLETATPGFGWLMVRRVYRDDANFRVTKLSMKLDRTEFVSTEDPAVTGATSYVAFRGPMKTGKHVLKTHDWLAGEGSGVFSYMNAYRFEAPGEYAFELSTGELACLTQLAWFADGSAPMQERPRVTFELETRELR